MGQAGITLSRDVTDVYYVQKVKLGHGTFGTVWRGVDKQTNALVAIKKLDKAAMPSRGVRREDIEREIAVMKAVDHYNVTHLLDNFEDHRSIYLALEYCDGGDFGDKVKERGTNLKEPEAADWMSQICSAINALHDKAICHRDIKPDNFMVHGDLLKLADFGLALHLPYGRLLTEKCGTPAFMSPEQHKLPRHSRGYGYPCDMWAAGIAMYMLMLGGRHPFLNGSGTQLDERALVLGQLDFSSNSVLGFAGIPDSRFSEKARVFCKQMVQPSPQFRITAEEALQDPWLQQAPRRHNGVGSGTTASPTAVNSLSRTNSMEESWFVSSKATSYGSNSGSIFDFRFYGCDAPQVTEGASEKLSVFPDEKSGRETEDDVANRIKSLEAQLEFQRENLEAMRQLKAPRSKANEGFEASSEGFGRVRSSSSRPSQPKTFDTLMESLTTFASTMSSSYTAATVFQTGGYYQADGELVLREAESLDSNEIAKVQMHTRLRVLHISATNSRRAMIRTERGQEGWISLWQTDGRTLVRSPTGDQKDYQPAIPLQAGLKCLYRRTSNEDAWISTAIRDFNKQDGTYNLVAAQKVHVENIRPSGAVSQSECWPVGTDVEYWHPRANAWIPAVIQSYNAATMLVDGTYNLDLCRNVAVDRIRPFALQITS